MDNLREKTIRGGAARVCTQGISVLVRMGSLMVLARLLDPKDFGLVGMVTAFTGVLTLFRDFGLSSAAIQRATVSKEQMSTLFWINILVGTAMACVAAMLAPAIAAFYREPRLVEVTLVIATGFFFNAVGVQHGVILQREMRFTTLSVISMIALIGGTAIAIGGAIRGYGYWSLVAMATVSPLISTVGFWIATGWLPGRPARRSGIRSMLHFGGTVTLNGLIVYVATNFEKILLGRFWGVDAVGLYGRAYQLINIPTDNLNSAAGEVAFAALSRLQDEPKRLKSYFLKGYSLVLGFTVPLTIACALFGRDIVEVFLGPKWKGASAIFQLLAPTVLVFAIANPLSWLLSSLGMIKRLLRMGFVITPIMIAAYCIGLPYGPRGVALSYSTIMTLWLVPLVIWALHGTVVSPRDVLQQLIRPAWSAVIAAIVAIAVCAACARALSPLYRLTLETGVFLLSYLFLLLIVGGQKAFYFDLLRGVMGKTKSKEPSLASA